MVNEDCLVDTWVTNERTAFMDLTAGPFHWGPLIAADGVSSPLPSLFPLLSFFPFTTPLPFPFNLLSGLILIDNAGKNEIL